MNYLNRLRIPVTLILVLFWTFASFGAANGSDEKLIRSIEDALIAPCCWNQPISQHYSEVSEQMRQEVRAMVAEGKSRDEILDFYVAKYGERILATPRPKGINLLAYILPWTALILGGWILIILLRKRRASAPAPASNPLPRSGTGYDEIIEKEMKELDK